MDTGTQEIYAPSRVAARELSELPVRYPGLAMVDEMARNLEELFLLRNPQYRFNKVYGTELEIFRAKMSRDTAGEWFYYPWSNTAVRFLPEALHNELRTGRNKRLITGKEQETFYQATGAFFGMSVGSHGAIVTAMTGGMRKMKLADPDRLSGDNLNRIRTGFQNVGQRKVAAAARQIYEMNPYAELELFPEGVTEENADAILEGCDIAVEEMDDPYWKFRIRELARAKGIPVIMATDNGDGVIMDIERFDLDPKAKLFNGLVGDLSAEALRTMSPKDLPKIAGKIAGASLTVPRMLESVAEVGTSLYSWPQLGTAANMCGTLIAAMARRIVNKDPLIGSGRYSVNPDAIFEKGYRWRWFSRKKALLSFILKMTRS